MSVSEVQCEEVMGKTHFDSYSEFYLALCMANDCKRLGRVFNMSKMRIDKGILPKEELSYFKHLLSEGTIKIDGFNDKVDASCSNDLYFDWEYIRDLYDVLVEEKDGKYFWYYDWAYEKYTSHRFDMLNQTKTGNNIMHIVGHLMLSFFVGEREKRPVIVQFDGNRAKSTYLYVNLYSCCATLEWFRKLVTVDVDFKGLKVDINYSIHCNNGRAAGRYKLWSASEKLQFMRELGMVEGSILILWTRKGMCKSSPTGKITSAVVVRVDEIGNDFIAVTSMPLNKTKEEVRMDFYSIREDRRHLFVDMLSQKPVISTKMLSIYETGIDNYFLDEYQFLTKLNKNERIVKRITVDGKEANVEMSGVDAIYWLLRQYNIEFDRDLFISMYNDGKPLLWDEYGE